jgi:competence protein ComGG
MNEKGFVFPMVLIIATSIMLLIGYLLEQYVLDKRFYKEVEESLMADHLIRLAVSDLEEDWKRMEGEYITIHNGIVFYPKGDVYYEVMGQDDNRASVRLYGSTINERKAIVVIRYDKVLRQVVKWKEN